MIRPVGARLRWASIAVVGLVLLPLAGLLAGLIWPPRGGFATEPPTLARLALQSGALRLLGTTLALAGVVTVVVVPLGTWLAWVEQRTRYPGARLLGVLDLMPLAMPSYIVASTVRESFGPGGWIGAGLGLPIFTGFAPAALVLMLVTVPYVQLLVAAGLMRGSAAEEEAARCLGAGSWRAFSTVLLPRLRPSLAFAWLIAALYVISDFGAVAVLDCPVLTWRLYQAVNHQQLGNAVLLGAAVLCATVPLLVGARFVHGAIPALATVANPRPPARRPLVGLPLALTFVAHAFVIGIGVLLPVIALLGWVIEGVVHGESFASLWVPLRDTAAAALCGAALTLLLASLPAWVAARTSPRRAWWTEQGTYLTSALPGVLIGFGLMLAALYLSRGLGSGGALYQALTGSGALLLLGYAMRFLAEGYGSLKAAVLQLDPRHEATARTLAVGRTRWLRRIVLPQVAPGAAAAFVLLLLALLKELPITLLLGGAMGLRTLAFRVYDRYQEAFLHDAGLSGLIMVALALAAVAGTLRWRRHV